MVVPAYRCDLRDIPLCLKDEHLVLNKLIRASFLESTTLALYLHDTQSILIS